MTTDILNLSKWDVIELETRMREHIGDPCLFCGIPHDEVPVGPCPGNDEIEALLAELHAKQYAITAHLDTPQVRADLRRCAKITQLLRLSYGITSRQITTELRRRDSLTE